MSKFTAQSFAARFPFTAEAIASECLGGSNGHFLKRINGSEGTAIMAAYDANERGDLLLASHPDLLAECRAVLPDYGWNSSILIVAYLTGRLGRLDKDGLCRTGSTTVFSCGQKAINLKDKLFQQLVYGSTSGQSARNEGEIFVNKYDAMTGKRKKAATAADAADVATSGQASAEEKALAAAIMADDRIPAYFDDAGILVYGLPSPEMLDAPMVNELGKNHAKLKADQDSLAATVGTLKKELTRKKLAAAKREQFQAQIIELENQLKEIALKLTRIENNPLYKKAG